MINIKTHQFTLCDALHEFNKEMEQMETLYLTFNETSYVFIKDNTNHTFKVFVNGELVKALIDADFFPTSIIEAGEFIFEYEL